MIPTIGTADREALEAGLKRLKLRRIREVIDEAAELATQEEPGYLDFVAYLVEQEIAAREQTQFQKRLKAARFREIKRLEDFDFAFQTSISRQTIAELANLGFIEAKENIALCGPSGVGKSHLAIALGYEAVKAGYRVGYYPFDELLADLYASLADGSTQQRMRSILRNDLIIWDELGFVSMDQTASDHVFQLVSRIYEQRSLIITTNLDFSEWGDLFGNTATATAVLDRFLHHAHVLMLKGDSYRMRSRLRPPTPAE
jgi:DNA replication protein DnaC